MSELDEIKKMNIYQRICAVSSAVGKINMTTDVATKTDKTTGRVLNSYKAISINDVVDALNPLLNKYRLVVIPGDKEIIEQNQLELKSKGYTTNYFYIRLKATYRVVNIDNPAEFVEGSAYGDGLDTGDKCTGKALTYSRKYVLIDIFNLSKGEDADDVASPQEGESFERMAYQKKPQPSPQPIQSQPVSQQTDMAVAYSTMTRELMKIGIDIHNEKVSAFIKDKAKVSTLDGGQLLSDPAGMQRAITVMTAVLKEKSKEQKA